MSAPSTRVGCAVVVGNTLPRRTGGEDTLSPNGHHESDDEAQGQPAALVEAVLRADPAKLPTFVGVDLGADGYAVARVQMVLPLAEQTAELASQIRLRYEQLWGMAEALSYYESLKARYKAQILVPRPEAPSALTMGAAPASR